MFKQFEILLEGFNPEAGGPMTADELSRVRAAMQPQEQLLSFVRGRIVGAGTGLWALTDQRLLTLRSGRRGQADAFGMGQIQQMELQPGRYGSTLALYTADQRLSLFAAEPALAAAFAQALTAVLPQGAVQGRASKQASFDAETTADVATWLSWSRLRLQPEPQATMTENLALLREAANLHERGVLGAAEFGALKGRLLDAA